MSDSRSPSEGAGGRVAAAAAGSRSQSGGTSTAHEHEEHEQELEQQPVWTIAVAFGDRSDRPGMLEGTDGAAVGQFVDLEDLYRQLEVQPPTTEWTVAALVSFTEAMVAAELDTADLPTGYVEGRRKWFLGTKKSRSARRPVWTPLTKITVRGIFAAGDCGKIVLSCAVQAPTPATAVGGTTPASAASRVRSEQMQVERTETEEQEEEEEQQQQHEHGQEQEQPPRPEEDLSMHVLCLRTALHAKEAGSEDVHCTFPNCNLFVLDKEAAARCRTVTGAAGVVVDQISAFNARTGGDISVSGDSLHTWESSAKTQASKVLFDADLYWRPLKAADKGLIARVSGRFGERRIKDIKVMLLAVGDDARAQRLGA
eukprot:COSAG01_NODE_11882_length_1842_cov_1.040161_2_plen_369_part_01